MLLFIIANLCLAYAVIIEQYIVKDFNIPDIVRYFMADDDDYTCFLEIEPGKSTEPAYMPAVPTEDDLEYLHYLSDYGKSYPTKEEYETRIAIFHKT